jgi:hypothetical protein
MEAIYSYETSVDIQQTAQRYIPEARTVKKRYAMYEYFPIVGLYHVLVALIPSGSLWSSSLYIRMIPF